MEASIKIVALMVSLMVFLSAAHSESGTASYSTPGGPPTACIENPTTTLPLAAAGPAIWGSNGACGKRYRITCTGGSNPSAPNPCTGASADVQIDDFCPACATTFDLSQDAFATIAKLDAGIISIEYNQL